MPKYEKILTQYNEKYKIEKLNKYYSRWTYIMKLSKFYEQFPVQEYSIIDLFNNTLLDYNINKYYFASLFSKYFGPMYIYYFLIEN